MSDTVSIKRFVNRSALFLSKLTERDKYQFWTSTKRSFKAKSRKLVLTCFNYGGSCNSLGDRYIKTRDKKTRADI